MIVNVHGFSVFLLLNSRRMKLDIPLWGPLGKVNPVGAKGLIPLTGCCNGSQGSLPYRVV
jgi:hypothetical protein